MVETAFCLLAREARASARLSRDGFSDGAVISVSTQRPRISRTRKRGHIACSKGGFPFVAGLDADKVKLGTAVKALKVARAGGIAESLQCNQSRWPSLRGRRASSVSQVMSRHRPEIQKHVNVKRLLKDSLLKIRLNRETPLCTTCLKKNQKK
jgi:hypothetical protein